MKKKTNNFLESTLLSVVTLLRDTIADERIAAHPGFLQRRDPRVKVASLTLILIAVLFSKNVVPLAALYGVCLFLVIVSGAGIIGFLKRTLLFVPLFSLFVALPAIFDFVTPGEAIAELKIGAWHLAVTRRGVDTALMFFMRVLTSVSFAVLLVLTTRHHVLLTTLRIFKVPQVFVMTMGISYRYIFVLLDIIRSTFISIKSRTGFVSSGRAGGSIPAAIMAGLWLRSYRMHGRIYDAMVSRGYTGEPVTMYRPKAGPVDAALMLSSLCVLIGILWLNRFFH